MLWGQAQKKTQPRELGFNKKGHRSPLGGVERINS